MGWYFHKLGKDTYEVDQESPLGSEEFENKLGKEKKV